MFEERNCQLKKMIPLERFSCYEMLGVLFFLYAILSSSICTALARDRQTQMESWVRKWKKEIQTVLHKMIKATGQQEEKPAPECKQKSKSKMVERGKNNRREQ